MEAVAVILSVTEQGGASSARQCKPLCGSFLFGTVGISGSDLQRSESMSRGATAALASPKEVKVKRLGKSRFR